MGNEPLDSDEEGALPSLADQYKELCNDSRHLDQKLWLLPSTAYTISAVFYGVIFDPARDASQRFLLAVLNTIAFSGFVFQYVKERAYQLETQAAITRIHRLAPKLLKVSQYAGTLKGDKKRDRWFIRYSLKYSAANYVFYVLMVILIVNGLVAVIFAMQMLGFVPQAVISPTAVSTQPGIAATTTPTFSSPTITITLSPSAPSTPSSP